VLPVESTNVPAMPNPRLRSAKFSELTNGWKNTRAAQSPLLSFSASGVGVLVSLLAPSLTPLK
jgi:hypothetical protein